MIQDEENLYKICIKKLIKKNTLSEYNYEKKWVIMIHIMSSLGIKDKLNNH